MVRAGKGLSGTMLGIVKHLPRKDFKVAFRQKNAELKGVKSWFDIRYQAEGDKLKSLRVRQASGIGNGKVVSIKPSHDIVWHHGGDSLTGMTTVSAVELYSKTTST